MAFDSGFRPSQDLGQRPELSWLALDKLVSDPIYQRPVNTLRSGRLIDLMVACGDTHAIDRDRLARVLQETTSEELIEAARTDRRHNRRPTEVNIRASIVTRYNQRLPEDRRLPAPF
ncbi:hypothetical protein [Azospirillum sp. A39]|uniref:hypothetical protein n=1 Tax=Azospirillum sp. A39 TaxID=3462279 RepID=UPI00404579D3